MSSFLHKVANYIIIKHFDNLRHVLILMPNRRSCLFLENEFVKQLDNKTTWLPKIISLKDWINQNSVLSKADELVLLFYLYNIYEKNVGSDIIFDDFFYIGRIILNDFNDVDNECVDAEKLFLNINEYEQLKEQFSIYNEISKIFFKENFLTKNDSLTAFKKIWNSIGKIYNDYTSFLIDKRIGYDGLINRYFIEKLDELNLTKNVYFVGLNALSKSEQFIVEKIYKKTNSTFLWEYNDWYIKNESNSAGKFLREWIKKYPNPSDFIFQDNNISQKNFNIYEFDNEIAQIKYLPELLKKNKSIDDNKEYKIAIVLLNEKLLKNLLNSLPPDFNKVNITMGYSIVNTWIYSFLKLLFSIHIKQKNGEVNSNLLLNFLYHPYILNNDWAKNLINDVKKNAKYTYKLLNNEKEITDENIKKFLFKNQNFKEKINTLNIILNNIHNSINNADNEKNYLKIEILAIRKIANAIEKINELVQKFKIEFTQVKTWFNIIIQICSNQKIDLIGEPLSDVQIMGLFETRLLDFENIILLSLNEEYVNANHQFSTLILSSFRKHFELTFTDKYEAITAFHFYSLLQKSSNVHLCFAKLIDEKPAEQSVYIRQIKYDKSVKKNEFKPTLSFKISSIQLPIIISKQNYEWKEFLNNLNTFVFSRSVLSDYIICSLRFYFKYVLKLMPSEFFIETNERIETGIEIHEALKNIFSNNNKIFRLEDFDYINLDEKLNKENSLQTINETIKLLQIKQYIKNFFDFEKKQSTRKYPVEIISTEKLLHHEILVNNHRIKLEGKPDLILKANNAIYIIDFKLSMSGSKHKLEKLEQLFEPNNKYNYAFQLCFYAYLFKKNQKDGLTPILIENIFMDNLYSEKNCFIMINDEIINFNSTYIVDDFENLLKNKTLEEIFNDNFPFKQTEEIKSCETCKYNVICKKN